MKKKILAIVMLPLFAVVLSGCALGNKLGAGQDNKNGDQSKGSAPTEMISACSGKSEGDSCETKMSGPQGSNQNGSQTLAGTCKKSQNDNQLVCRPSNMPDRPQQGFGPQGGQPANQSATNK